MSQATGLGVPVSSGELSARSRAIVARSGYRAVVAYWSRFGNTERIAEALAAGLRRVPGISVDCTSIGSLLASEVAGYDFVAVGGPTEIRSAPAPLKNFLAGLRPEGMRGKFGFAFDTRLDGRLSGSAGRYIERQLERIGLGIVRPHASAPVRGMTREERIRAGDRGAPEWVQKLEKRLGAKSPPDHVEFDLLTPESEARFVQIGVEIGKFIRAIVPFAVA